MHHSILWDNFLVRGGTSSTIVSVLSPVETALPKVGQRIMTLGITREAITQATLIPA
jgi:hypothetical protein